jgi:hypothetical protein
MGVRALVHNLYDLFYGVYKLKLSFHKTCIFSHPNHNYCEGDFILYSWFIYQCSLLLRLCGIEW